jgi:hypothetical protein
MYKLTKNDKLLLQNLTESPSDLVFWSFRYFLGRRTIATCCFARNLAIIWQYLDDRVKGLIKAELEKAFSYKALGDDCNRVAWQKVRDVYKKELENAKI